MKITEITPYFFEMPLAQPIADARNTIHGRSAVLLRIDTDEGVSGWGEAASFADCGSLVVHTIRFLAERIIGKNPLTASEIYAETARNTLHFGRKGLVVNALSGIDVALWDIIGKVRGLPLYKVLGAKRNSLDFYFNGGYFVDGDSNSFLRSSAERAVQRGAKAMKIKIGRNVQDDARRIEIARDILGSDRDLMVDANGILDLEYLRELSPVMLGQNIRWMEEPVAIGPVRTLQEVRGVLKTPIAGYELEQTAQGWTDLIDGETVDVAQPDAIWSGGITECVEVAASAALHGVEFVPHNFASIVCLAANAHLAASAETGGWLEVDSNDNPFLWDINATDSFKLIDGKIFLPDSPGLGLDINLEAVEKFRITP